MIKKLLGLVGLSPPKPPDFFKFSVARQSGQGWLWEKLSQGFNPISAYWKAVHEGLVWDRSEFQKDAYRMSRQQAVMRETRDLPRDQPIPQSAKIETVFNVPGETQRARIKFFGRDAKGRFSVRYREYYFKGDPTPGSLSLEALSLYSSGRYPSDLGLKSIHSARVEVVFYAEG